MESSSASTRRPASRRWSVREGSSVPSHRNRRIDFEYKRHGVVNLIAAFAVHTGHVVGDCLEKNDSAAFIRFIRRIMQIHPRRKLYLILDNGTTHRSKETTAFLHATSASYLVHAYPRLMA